jgi:hypothetical protein
MREWQWLKQYSIDDREDGCICSEADSERENGGD